MPERTAVEVDEEEMIQCRHHWIIESPHGAFSQGRCRLCGTRREFRNSAPDAYWENDSSTEIGRWGKGRPVAVSSDDDEMSASARRGEATLVL